MSLSAGKFLNYFSWIPYEPWTTLYPSIFICLKAAKRRRMDLVPALDVCTVHTNTWRGKGLSSFTEQKVPLKLIKTNIELLQNIDNIEVSSNIAVRHTCRHLCILYKREASIISFSLWDPSVHIAFMIFLFWTHACQWFCGGLFSYSLANTGSFIRKYYVLRYFFTFMNKFCLTLLLIPHRCPPELLRS